ncbi:DUF928 domain-containing protein [Pantanalinema rosaneae CENA516]|uniref:DUF928 domain-containing protein n=1 Tax=Pantanalinema rosaneae TaxID=1620701 RepID=UPI003D6F2B29
MGWTKIYSVGTYIAVAAFMIISPMQCLAIAAVPAHPTLKLAQFEPPVGKGAPSQTAGGGRRQGGICSNSPASMLEQSLVALMPSNMTGLVLAERPTFLFYVPKTAAKTAEFVLDDVQSGQRLVRAVVNIPESPGIYSFTPDLATPLQLDQEYAWVFSMVCGEEGDVEDALVRGRVRRIKADSALVSQLAQATPLEQVTLYARSGIWFEAVNSLVALRSSQPNDPELTAAWQKLLQSVGLAAIAAAPLKLAAQ